MDIRFIKEDMINNSISVLSFLISIIALYMSYKSYKLSSENLKIKIIESYEVKSLWLLHIDFYNFSSIPLVIDKIPHNVHYINCGFRYVVNPRYIIRRPDGTIEKGKNIEYYINCEECLHLPIKLEPFQSTQKWILVYGSRKFNLCKLKVTTNTNKVFTKWIKRHGILAVIESSSSDHKFKVVDPKRL